MASGDVLLDASGNVILDSSGNVQLSDGSGDGCCCSTTTYYQAKKCGVGLVDKFVAAADLPGTSFPYYYQETCGNIYYFDGTTGSPGTIITLGDYTAVTDCVTPYLCNHCYTCCYSDKALFLFSGSISFSDMSLPDPSYPDTATTDAGNALADSITAFTSSITIPTVGVLYNPPGTRKILARWDSTSNDGTFRTDLAVTIDINCNTGIRRITAAGELTNITSTTQSGILPGAYLRIGGSVEDSTSFNTKCCGWSSDSGTVDNYYYKYDIGGTVTVTNNHCCRSSATSPRPVACSNCHVDCANGSCLDAP